MRPVAIEEPELIVVAGGDVGSLAVVFVGHLHWLAGPDVPDHDLVAEAHRGHLAGTDGEGAPDCILVPVSGDHLALLQVQPDGTLVTAAGDQNILGLKSDFVGVLGVDVLEQVKSPAGHKARNGDAPIIEAVE